MTSKERREYIEKMTNQKISSVELRRNISHYYGEYGQLIAKYYHNRQIGEKLIFVKPQA